LPLGLGCEGGAKQRHQKYNVLTKEHTSEYKPGDGTIAGVSEKARRRAVLLIFSE